MSSTGHFQVLQRTVSDSKFKELFQPNGVEFQEIERGFYSQQSYIQKPPSSFTQVSQDGII